MARPVIGVTTRASGLGGRPGPAGGPPREPEAKSSGEPPEKAPPKPMVGCELAYADAVARSGGSPVLLPRTDEMQAVTAAMARVDGLLLTGGGDVDPRIYGEAPHPKGRGFDAVRDRMEAEAVRVAIERGIPVLGICRGMQSLNVALGGTLIQDVPSEVEGAVRHRTWPGQDVFAHEIEVEEGTLLARVLGATGLSVNSLHHQAVGRPGRGLRVNARAPDGVIEGLESEPPREGDGGRLILAVQCHPERLYEDHPVFRKLFDWLVAEAEEATESARGQS